jgi:hypothetical protein
VCRCRGRLLASAQASHDRYTNLAEAPRWLGAGVRIPAAIGNRYCEASDELDHFPLVESLSDQLLGIFGVAGDTYSRSPCLARTRSALSSAVSVLPDAVYCVTVTNPPR